MLMRLEQKPQAPFTLIKDGVYRARLVEVRQYANGFGGRLGFVFVLVGGSEEGRQLIRSTASHLGQQGKLAETLTGLLGRGLTEMDWTDGLDQERLIGLECNLLVLQAKGKDSNIYSNIERVFAI